LGDAVSESGQGAIGNCESSRRVGVERVLVGTGEGDAGHGGRNWEEPVQPGEAYKCDAAPVELGDQSTLSKDMNDVIQNYPR
jgi:hypothetical protein